MKKKCEDRGEKNSTWSLSFATFMVFLSHPSNNKTARKGRVGLWAKQLRWMTYKGLCLKPASCWLSSSSYVPHTPEALLRGQTFIYSHDITDWPRYRGFLGYIEFLLGGFPFREISLSIQLSIEVHCPLKWPGTWWPCPTVLQLPWFLFVFPLLLPRSHWSQ